MSALLANSGAMLHGLLVTIEASLGTLIISTVLGFIIMGMRLLEVRGLSVIAGAYVEFFQNAPYPLLVFVMYYGLPQVGIKLAAIPSAILGLSLYSSAYIAEALRSGVRAIAQGQMDAGHAAGLSRSQVVRTIVLRQALVYALPAVTNQWSRIVKNSTVLAIVGGQDLLFEAQNLSDITFQVFAFYGGAGIGYWLLSLPVTSGSRLVELVIPWRRAQLGQSVRWLDRLPGIRPVRG